MPRGAPADRSLSELEGYAAGLAHRLDRRRSEGRPEPLLEFELAGARQELARGQRPEAAARLHRVDARLGVDEEESELVEFPRGLVGYVPRGDRGAPVPPDEGSLAHRRRLVLHLMDLVVLDEPTRREALRLLTEAEARLRSEDRVAAKSLIDAAHALVERAPRAGAPPPNTP